MRFIQLSKAALVACAALFFTLAAFGNVTDYGSNWQFVQHVLAMDTIFPYSALHWRAITSPALQGVAYWLIIAWEVVTAVILWIGVIRLFRPKSAAEFTSAKPAAVLGLTMGFILYAMGFVDIGGEWFAMWQSRTWNGQQTAFELLAMISAVLIILLIPEAAEG